MNTLNHSTAARCFNGWYVLARWVWRVCSSRKAWLRKIRWRRRICILRRRPNRSFAFHQRRTEPCGYGITTGLAKRDGQALEGFDRFIGLSNSAGGLMKSPFEFKPHGQSGKHVSSIFPNLSKHVDKMAFIHSGHGEQQPFTGARDESWPAANGVSVCWPWVTYGLGRRATACPRLW